MIWPVALTVGGPPGFVGMILDKMGDKAGMDYLTKLAAQDVVNNPTNQLQVMESVASGEHPLSLNAENFHVEVLKSQGAHVEWLKSIPWVTSFDAGFIVKGAPHPNAAKLFLDFLASEDGQKVIVDAGFIPVDPKVPAKVADLKPEVGKFEAWNPSYQETVDNLDKWTQIYKSLFVK